MKDSASSGSDFSGSDFTGPDFIGIGTSKAATTSLTRLIAQHPDICFSEPSKLFYFNTYNTFWLGGKTGDNLNPKRDKSLEWYKSHFNHCPTNSIKGEFTPSYLADPDAARRMHEAFPNAKLIVCLRDPVERAYSHYQMVKNYHRREKRSFEQAIQEEAEYIEKGLYGKHLQTFLTLYDRSQLHVVTVEELKGRPADAIRRVYRFLGASDSFMPDIVDVKENSAKHTRSRWVRNFERFFIKVVSTLGIWGLVRWLKKNNVHTWIHALNSKSYKYPEMNEETKKYLRQLFLKDIELAERLLGRRFPAWKASPGINSFSRENNDHENNNTMERHANN